MKKARGWEVKGSNASEITNLIGPRLVIKWEQGSIGDGSKAQPEMGARGSTTEDYN